MRPLAHLSIVFLSLPLAAAAAPDLQQVMLPQEPFTAEYDTTATITLKRTMSQKEIESHLIKIEASLRTAGFKADEVERNLAAMRKDLEGRGKPERTLSGHVTYAVKGPDEFRVTGLVDGAPFIDEYTTGTLRLVRPRGQNGIWLQGPCAAGSADEAILFSVYIPLRKALADSAMKRSGDTEDVVMITVEGKEFAYRFDSAKRVVSYQTAAAATTDVTLEYDGPDDAVPSRATYTIRQDESTSVSVYERRRLEHSVPANLCKDFLPAFAEIADKRTVPNVAIEWQGPLDLAAIEAKLQQERASLAPAKP